MNLQDILAKAAKGEQLSEEEKTFASGFNLQSQLDATAAAARKKAEEAHSGTKSELEKAIEAQKTLQAKIDEAGNAGKTEVEKKDAQIKALSDQLAGLGTKLTGMEEAAKTAARTTALGNIMQTSGIAFIDGIDRNIPTRAFNDAFSAISTEQLMDEAVVKPVIATFAAMNKGIILDKSGTGSPEDPHKPSSQVGSNGKPIDQQTTEERANDLRAARSVGGGPSFTVSRTTKG